MSQMPYIGQSQIDEHRKENNAKAVDNYVWDADNLTWVRSAGAADGSQKTQIVEKPPTDSIYNNPSTVYAYDSNGDLSTITKTIGAVQYRKTFTMTGGVLTASSVWVQI